MTLFKAVNELKDLAEKNGRDNDKWRLRGETKHVNSRNNNGRKNWKKIQVYFLIVRVVKKNKKRQLANKQRNKKQKEKTRKDTKKKKNSSVKPCNTTRMKMRKFLTNISYNDITEEDFFNRPIVFDVYVFLTKKVNPFSIERKVQEQTIQKIVYMLCIANNFNIWIYFNVFEQKKYFIFKF